MLVLITINTSTAGASRCSHTSWRACLHLFVGQLAHILISILFIHTLLQVKRVVVGVAGWACQEGECARVVQHQSVTLELPTRRCGGGAPAKRLVRCGSTGSRVQIEPVRGRLDRSAGDGVPCGGGLGPENNGITC
jgi:hypothetical protein